MATFDGLTKAQITGDLAGNADEKSKCLDQIAEYGEGAACYLGYGLEISRCLKDPSRPVKVATLRAIAATGSACASSVEMVASYIKDSDLEVKCAAVAALGGLGAYSGHYEQEIVELTKDQAPEIRAAAAQALGGMKAGKQISVLKRCLSDSDPKVIAGALRGAGLLGDWANQMSSDISACLENQDAGVRLAALDCLTKLGEQASAQASQVAACLADENNAVRQAAVSYFSEVPLGMRAYNEVGNIEKLLEHKDGRAQAAAAVALGNVQANHGILMERLSQERPLGDGAGDLPKKALPLTYDAKKLIALLDSKFEDEEVIVLAAAGLEPKPSAELRRPACAAASALGIFHCSDAIEPLSSKLSASSPKEVTASFLSALGGMKELPTSVSSKIPAYLKDTTPIVRAGACLALGAGEESAADLVAARMKDAHPAVRAAAAEAAANMKAAKLSDEICELLSDRNPKVQVAAMKALANMGPKGEMYAAEIAKVALSGNDEVRIAATEVLVSMGARGASYAEEMTHLLEDTEISVRKAGLDALAKMGEGAKPFLANAQSMVNDPCPDVRSAAEAAVAALRAA